MNCDCVKKSEARLAQTAFIQAKAGANATVECTAAGFMLTDDGALRSTISIPFRVRGSGKGYASNNGKTHPFIAGYCPFCGLTTGSYVVGEYDGLSAI